MSFCSLVNRLVNDYDSLDYKDLIQLLAFFIILACIFIYSSENVKGLTNISNCTDLMNIANNVSEDYQLVNDIDCSNTTSSNFVPIDSFNAIFNGQGYNISGLYIMDSDVNVGLFGSTTTLANIINVSLILENVTGGTEKLFSAVNVGGLVGLNNGNISNISISGKVILSGGTITSNAGGIAGKNTGIIKDSYSTAIVTLDLNTSDSNYWNIGGLIGSDVGGIISNCHASGEVLGNNTIGGFIGYAESTTIKNCSATGDVTASSTDIGGFIGETINIKISNSYATGNVETIGGYVGGFIGRDDSGATNFINNSYATGDVSTAGSRTGGFIGNSAGGITINNSYSTGRVQCYDVQCGGFIGNSWSNIYNCFTTADANSTKNWSAAVIGHYTGGTISNLYWNNKTSNTDFCMTASGVPSNNGCTAIQNDKEYFYNQSNLPLSNWLYPPWDTFCDIKGYPSFLYDHLTSLNYCFGYILPNATILWPLNDSYQVSPVDLNFTVNVSIDWCAYSLDNGSNNTAINGPVNTTLTSLADGLHNVTIYCNDSSGFIGRSEYVYFTVDTINPVINITYPINGSTYNTSKPQLNFTYTDNTSSPWCGYSIDGGANDSSITGPNNVSLHGLSYGEHNITVYCNDSAGNIGFDNITINISSVFINITIQSPVNGSIYTVSSVELNFSTDQLSDWCGYSLDNTANNSAINGPVNATMTGIANGTHNVTIYCNDTSGYISQSNYTYFEVDFPPQIDILYPVNDTNYSITDLALNWTANEDTDWCAYSLDGSANETNITGPVNTTIGSIVEGNHNITIYCNDSRGTMGQSNYTYFYIDRSLPNITINSPVNDTTYKASTINLIFNYNDSSEADWCGYSLDGAANNSNITGPVNIILSSLSESSHNITIYCNDSLGNMGQSLYTYFTVTFANIPYTVNTSNNYSNIVTYGANSFNNSISSENLTFGENVSYIRYIALSPDSNVTVGLLNVTGYSNITIISLSHYNILYNHSKNLCYFDIINHTTINYAAFNISGFNAEITTQEAEDENLSCGAGCDENFNSYLDIDCGYPVYENYSISGVSSANLTVKGSYCNIYVWNYSSNDWSGNAILSLGSPGPYPHPPQTVEIPEVALYGEKLQVKIYCNEDYTCSSDLPIPPPTSALYYESNVTWIINDTYNVTIDIGADGDIEFNHTGKFNTSNQTINLSSEIQTYLSSCIPDGKYKCYIPINLSYTGGRPLINNFTINHTPSIIFFTIDVGNNGIAEFNTSEGFTSTNTTSDFSAAVNTYLSNCTAASDGYCHLPINISSANNIFQINGLNLTSTYNISRLFGTHYIWNDTTEIVINTILSREYQILPTNTSATSDISLAGYKLLNSSATNCSINGTYYIPSGGACPFAFPVFVNNYWFNHTYWENTISNANAIVKSNNSINVNDYIYFNQTITYYDANLSVALENTFSNTTDSFYYNSSITQNITLEILENGEWFDITPNASTNCLTNPSYTRKNINATHSISYDPTNNASNGTWAFFYPVSHLFDNDTESCAYATNNESYVFINYTKPSGNLLSAVWNVTDNADNNFYSRDTTNISLPSSCITAYADKFVLAVRSRQNSYYATGFYVTWFCHNGSRWQILRHYGGYSQSGICEESLIVGYSQRSYHVCLDTTHQYVSYKIGENP